MRVHFDVLVLVLMCMRRARLDGLHICDKGSHTHVPEVSIEADSPQSLKQGGMPRVRACACACSLHLGDRDSDVQLAYTSFEHEVRREFQRR